MTTKTQTSSIAMKTLRGVFEQPKMNHRRDFLRENKLNLRELQKNTTHKLTQQKQEQDRKQYKHLQKYQKSQELTGARRSASQCRNVGQKDGRQTRLAAGVDNGVDNSCERQSFRRAYSQQRESRENLQPTISYEQQAGDSSSCCCVQPAPPQQQQYHQQQQQHHHQQQQQQYRQKQQHHQPQPHQTENDVPRSASNISVHSKAESCDKEMQTEDINDEDFLYEALKKCSFSEVSLNKQKGLEQLRNRDNSQTRSNVNHQTQQHDHGLNSIYSRDQPPFAYHDHYEDNKSQPDQIYSSRSQCSNKLNGNSHEADVHDDGMTNEDIEHNFQNLKINSNIRREQEQHSSARSRQTLCSTTSKKNTNGSVHKLGCRDDLRLPRYLEKEKREKEQERVREINKDPNCPLGHYALSEHERIVALQNTQQKMSSLVNELNHMPMTTETLRIRNRKVEIEKELQQLEQDIRTYSKQKVYVSEPSIQY